MSGCPHPKISNASGMGVCYSLIALLQFAETSLLPPELRRIQVSLVSSSCQGCCIISKTHLGTVKLYAETKNSLISLAVTLEVTEFSE